MSMKIKIIRMKILVIHRHFSLATSQFFPCTRHRVVALEKYEYLSTLGVINVMKGTRLANHFNRTECAPPDNNIKIQMLNNLPRRRNEMNERFSASWQKMLRNACWPPRRRLHIVPELMSSRTHASMHNNRISLLPLNSALFSYISSTSTSDCSCSSNLHAPIIA